MSGYVYAWIKIRWDGSVTKRSDFLSLSFNDDVQVHIMLKIVPDYCVLMLFDKIRKNMEIT